MSRRKARIFDEYLAASARAGDRAAFARLAERWQPKLLAHAYRLLGDGEAARDAVQEAWADIVRGLSRLDDARAFPAWAYRIVTRRAADIIRKRQRDRKLSAAYSSETKSALQYEAPVEAIADAGPLRAAMVTLPAEQRAAIALFYTEDFSVAEIAAALNVPAGTVKTRLMHARRKLRAALEGV
ncbi:RNA polymerase sigma factor [Hyphococcus sp.]|uniref:RNA polymerase sigma factor n=1 Tax=Hyphococcus sp. TaxID=2038636 RepID=UPI0035C6D122